MPRGDNVIFRYLATARTGSGGGSTYSFELQEEDGLWAEVVQVQTPPANLGGNNFTADVLYKVRMQRPETPYDLENTRFVWTWLGETKYLQPHKSPVRSGTRNEKIMLHCKEVRNFLE